MLKLFLHLIQYAGFILGQVTNAMLLFLVLTRAEKLFGSFRNVMAAFSAYSLGYTWIEVLAEPVMHIKGSMFIVMMDGPIKLDVAAGNVLAALYCGSSALCISLLTAQFYYRYVAVCKPEFLEKIKGWKLSLLFIPCIFCFVGWFSLVHYGMHNTQEKQDFMRDVMLENYGVEISNESFIGPMYYLYDNTGKCTWRWLDIMASVLCTCILSTGLSLIAFCIIKIYSKLKSAEVIMSAKTRELNRQLFVTLSFQVHFHRPTLLIEDFQTIVPLVMMYGPVGAFITLPYFEVEVGLLGNYVGASAGVYPAIEPMIAIFFIKDFRNAVLCRNGKRAGARRTYFLGSTSQTRVSDIPSMSFH
ncbi:hypothetical protein CAEBREN_14674 [Caenorhabditis brenneri]|uniref:Serpentine receptor class r-10 n=1 Tax=Caenorhabditis brenneri TaxID=135651 RepID=G0NIX3_CAEBE|nr:hypothetical protein CAEBREN_14674 [Caenorhabditis brenneri]